MKFKPLYIFSKSSHMCHLLGRLIVKKIPIWGGSSNMIKFNKMSSPLLKLFLNCLHLFLPICTSNGFADRTTVI